MTGPPVLRTAIQREWIDYNGHLRDAYYGLIVSLAADALMEQLGMNAAYRERTRCTLYTLEMHMHFLREVKESDVVEVALQILDCDHKRIHAAFRLTCPGHEEPVAAAEVMLLHVHQGATPAATPFPAEIVAALQRLRDAAGPVEVMPVSRRMELRRRS